MSIGKNEAKNVFFIEERELKKCEQCFQTSCVLNILSCQNSANTNVFSSFALRAGNSKSEENTRIYDAF